MNRPVLLTIAFGLLALLVGGTLFLTWWPLPGVVLWKQPAAPTAPLPVVQGFRIHCKGVKTKGGGKADLCELLDDDDRVLARGVPGILERLRSFAPDTRARTSIAIGLWRSLEADFLARLLGELSKLGYSRVRVYPVDPD